eukprot:345289-Chlamydomonas_euryale.AAC.4
MPANVRLLTAHKSSVCEHKEGVIFKARRVATNREHDASLRWLGGKGRLKRSKEPLQPPVAHALLHTPLSAPSPCRCYCQKVIGDVSDIGIQRGHGYSCASSS